MIRFFAWCDESLHFERTGAGLRDLHKAFASMLSGYDWISAAGHAGASRTRSDERLGHDRRFFLSLPLSACFPEDARILPYFFFASLNWV